MQWGSILVGLDAPARDVIPAVRQAVAAIDPTLPIYNAETLDASIGRQLANDALLTRLTTCFAALALVVAALGLYGVLARGVAERRREFGIRAALGAGPASVARLVGGEAARVVLVGIAIGLTTSWWLAKFLEDQLFGISRFDLVSFGSAAGLIAIVAAVAALPPVRRAARLDLSEMLRI
jgi:ABC-type antimicrobial peptide transport system permease subunit